MSLAVLALVIGAEAVRAMADSLKLTQVTWATASLLDRDNESAR